MNISRARDLTMNVSVPSLRTFATDWRKVQQENDDIVRKRLAAERALLIKNGSLSERLREVLRAIFVLYCESPEDRMDDEGDDEDVSLSCTMASRLWYRCGMKLANLESILADKQGQQNVYLKDFLSVIEKVIAEDEAVVTKRSRETTALTSTFEVRDPWCL
jgi:hypothetical protein